MKFEASKGLKFVDINRLPYYLKIDLLNWRNQDFVRKNMFTNKIISLEEHKEYLEGLEKNRSRKVFVGFLNDEPFGVIYFNIFSMETMVPFV